MMMMIIMTFDAGPLHGLQLTLNVQQYENLPFANQDSGIKASLCLSYIKPLSVVITCAPAMLRAGIVFAGVCVSECLSAESWLPFEWLYFATSFLGWGYIFRISRSQFSFKVMGPRSHQ